MTFSWKAICRFLRVSKAEREQKKIGHNNRPGYAFLLPWPYECEGGVTHAVYGLMKECILDAAYQPLAFEVNWSFSRPTKDQWRGITRIRLRLRPPWSAERPIRTAVSYVLNLPRELYRIRWLIKHHDLQVLNRQFPGLDSFSLVLMRRLGLFCGKNILTFQGSDVRLVLNTRGITRGIWHWMLRGVDLLVFVSEGLKEEFLTFDPNLGERSVVIHNGVDVEAFTSCTDELVSCPNLFDGPHQIILSVGQFEHRKGHDLIVRAFELVVRERKDARLAIVGRSGPTFDATRKLIIQHGLADQVTLLTDVPYCSMPTLFGRAHVFVLCSRLERGKFGEGFPLVLAEAGALAKPVVSTRSTGCNEIIWDGQTGRLVAVEDHAALARAILDLLNDREAAQRMGINLYQLVHERFTWRHAWQKYREIAKAS